MTSELPETVDANGYDTRPYDPRSALVAEQLGDLDQEVTMSPVIRYSHDAIAQAEQWAATSAQAARRATGTVDRDFPEVQAAAQVSQAYSQLALALLSQERTGA